MSSLTIGEDGKVLQWGIDHGGYGQVIAMTRYAITVKWPAGKHWGGLGQERRSHPPRISVYTIIAANEEKRSLDVREVIDWQTPRGMKPVENERISKMLATLAEHGVKP